MHAVEDERLTQFTKICLAFPDAERTLQGVHAKFTVKKKTFAYFVNDHHGDGIVGVWCKALAGDNVALIKADPKRFYMPAYVGPRGWVGLRLDVGRTNWSEVRELVKGSYLSMAVKSVDAMRQRSSQPR